MFLNSIYRIYMKNVFIRIKEESNEYVMGLLIIDDVWIILFILKFIQLV